MGEEARMALTIVKMILMAFLVTILVVSLYLCGASVYHLTAQDGDSGGWVNSAIFSGLISINILFGLVGVLNNNLCMVLTFAIIQTTLNLLHWTLFVDANVDAWIGICWIGSAILAFVVAALLYAGTRD